MSQISDKGVIATAGAILTLGLGITGYFAERDQSAALAECLRTETAEVCAPLKSDNFLYTLGGFSLAGTGAVLLLMDGYQHPQPQTGIQTSRVERARREQE